VFYQYYQYYLSIQDWKENQLHFTAFRDESRMWDVDTKKTRRTDSRSLFNSTHLFSQLWNQHSITVFYSYSGSCQYECFQPRGFARTVTPLLFGRRVKISSRTPVLLSEIFCGFPEPLLVHTWTVSSNRLCHDYVLAICFHIHQKRVHLKHKQRLHLIQRC